MKYPSKNKKILRLTAYAFGSLRNAVLGRFMTFYPTVVNFSVTNRCNFNCIMCGLGPKAEKTTMTPNETSNIFSQDVFKKVRHVGISGGEPFLRDDLEQVIEEIIKALPNLRGVSIISNGSLPGRIKEKIPRIKDTCDSHGIDLSIMLSLDGVGEVHDKNRGVHGAFEKITESIEVIKKLYVKSFLLSCTITKTNIDDLNRVLNYAKHIGVPIKFRVATEINRLYNEDKKDNYSFNRLEIIRIVKFIDKLIYQHKKNLLQKVKYLSLRGQLLNNENRKSGCRWQKEGASIDPSGNLYYCFVKSKNLGNLLNNEGTKLFFTKSNLDYKQRLIEEECDSCIHDYNGYIPFSMMVEYGFGVLRNKLKPLSYGLFLSFFFVFHSFFEKFKSKKVTTLKTSYITGWYGTETVGDKAILGGIYESIRKINPQSLIYISSSVPYYSEETISQMRFNNIKITNKSLGECYRKIKESDIVIMGGGPLMDIGPTIGILWEFFIANLLRKPTIIFGCGLGPLNKKIFRITVRYILGISSLVMLRDEYSSVKYPEIVNGINTHNLSDPSINYLTTYSPIAEPLQKREKYVLFCVRDWPKNYSTLSYKEYKSKKIEFNQVLGSICTYILQKGYQVRFYPMNTYFVGDDDRDYYIELRKTIGEKENLFFYEKEYSLDKTLDIFKNAEFIIGMRFHSVVFGTALAVPTIAIDYDTTHGKVYGFVNKFGLPNLCINIKDISYSSIKQLTDEVIQHNNDYRTKLMERESLLLEYADRIDKTFGDFIDKKSIS